MTQKKLIRLFSGERANSSGTGEHTSFRGGERNFTAIDKPSETVQYLARLAAIADELQREYEVTHPGVKKRPSYDDFLDRAAEQLDEAELDD